MTIEEKKEILETFNWIKVKKYIELDPRMSSDDYDWKTEYFNLLNHHKKETDFLIKKVRDLVSLT